MIAPVQLAHALVSPPVFDFWAGLVDPAWSWRRPLARVVERRTEAIDAVTLVLKPNRHCAAIQPGQHVNVSAEINGRRTTRSYSPTATPRIDGHLALTIKRVEGGKLSNHLCDRVKKGDVLEIGTAFGDMTLPPAPMGKWLFLAAGSGITPLMGLTRALASQGMPVDLTLIYWARTRAEWCFAAELRDLAARHPGFKLHFVLTREAARQGEESQGRISPELMRQLAGDLAQRHVYACGPSRFIDAARDVAGPSAGSFQAESFTPPALIGAATGTVQIKLQASGRTLTVPAGQPLLAALESQGLQPASGCRMGVCHTCTCAKLEGTTQDLLTGETIAEPVSSLRICVSTARSDLTLDL